MTTGNCEVHVGIWAMCRHRWGPKSSAPGGYGWIDKDGYRSVRCAATGRKIPEHRIVWEFHNGPIPDGHDIHHANGDKLDNRIENLHAVSRLEHVRIHSGCEIRDGEWWKPCRDCNEFFHESHYYRRSGGGIHPYCRSCNSRRGASKRAAKTVPGDEHGEGA